MIETQQLPLSQAQSLQHVPEQKLAISNGHYVCVADRPILSEADEKYIRYLKPEQAAYESGMKGWTEFGALLGDGSPQSFINRDPLFRENLEVSQIVAEAKKTSQHLVACSLINPLTEKSDPKLGKGVFTTKPIKKGQVVGIYTGAYNSVEKSEMMCSYQMGGLDLSNVGKIVIDAEQYGNMARFMQHKFNSLPAGTNEEKNDQEITLEDYIFESEELKKQVSTANVHGVYEIMPETHPIYVFRANKDIPAYSEIGYDYGMNYWAVQKEIPLLYHNGTAIQPSAYTIKKPLYFVTNSSLTRNYGKEAQDLERFLKKTYGEDATLAYFSAISNKVSSPLPGSNPGNTPFVIVDNRKPLNKKSTLIEDKNAKWSDLRTCTLDPPSYKKEAEQIPVCSFAVPAETLYSEAVKLHTAGIKLVSNFDKQKNLTLARTKAEEALDYFKNYLYPNIEISEQLSYYDDLDSTTSAELNKSLLSAASCYSLLASIYRDQAPSDLLKAIRYCELALLLRRKFLSVDDSLIKTLEKKLESLKPLRTEQDKKAEMEKDSVSSPVETKIEKPTEEVAILQNSSIETQVHIHINSSEIKNDLIPTEPENLQTHETVPESKEIENPVPKKSNIHLSKEFHQTLSNLINRKKDKFVFKLTRQENEIVFELKNWQGVMLKESEVRDELVDLWRLFEGQNETLISSRLPNFKNFTLTVKAEPEILDEMTSVFREQSENYASTGSGLAKTGMFAPSLSQGEGSGSKNNTNRLKQKLEKNSFECRIH